MTYMPNNIKAVLFDMDGTLVDSESLTERAMLALLAERDLDTTNLDLVQFHGVTWRRIANRLLELYPDVAPDTDHLANEIEARFQLLFEQHPPDLIPGAEDAFRDAASIFPTTTTIVTGSESRAVEVLLDRTGLRDVCVGYTSCDQYRLSKPDPQSYLMAAERLRVAPGSCLVFEDSLPGMQAARAAGMSCIAITCGVAARVLQAQTHADDGIDDYLSLPPGFFEHIAAAA